MFVSMHFYAMYVYFMYHDETEINKHVYMSAL